MDSRPGDSRDGSKARYTIERVLSAGARSALYLARDEQLNRLVALRILNPGLVARRDRDSFRREIAIASRLDHPHVLPLHDTGEIDGRPFCTMPFVEGETLRERLEREVQLPASEAVRIARAIAGALDHMHAKGFVHGDVSPENILLATEPSSAPARPILVGFGLARTRDDAGGERLAEEDMLPGNPTYMSPEQAADGPVDPRSDLYALGCVTYEMLAGGPPFSGRSREAVLAQHAADPPPPLATVRATVPKSIVEAIERALAKRPEDRFETGAAFERALAAGRAQGRLLRGGHGVLTAGIAAAAVGVLSLAGGIAYVGRSRAPDIVPSAASMAVLPLAAEGGDSGLVRLGQDLAVTIGAGLDGVGGLEVASRLGLAEANDGRSLSLEAGAELARRLGASSFVRGTLRGARPLVRLDLALHQVDGLLQVGESIAVVTHRDSIRALTDSAVWLLLRQVWRRGEPPSPSLAAVTTGSLPALRAFLDGERELEAMRLEQAALAFQSAMAADSTFWLAHYRYALTQSWREEGVEPEVLQVLRLHRTGLPETEQLLVALMVDTMALVERVERSLAVTRRFPDYWPGWLAHADLLTHAGPFIGHDRSEALRAFGHTVAINPKLVAAWEHIFKLSLGRGYADTPRVVEQLLELGVPEEEEQMFRLWAGLDHTGGAITADLEPLVDSLAELFASTPGEYHRRHGAFGVPLLHFGFTSAQLVLNRRALRRGNVSMHPRRRSSVRTGSAYVWASMGRWDSAFTTLNQAAQDHAGLLGPTGFSIVVGLENYGLAVLAAWLGATPPGEADPLRALALKTVESLSDDEGKLEALARLAWYDGLLAFTRGDRGALQTAGEHAARSGYGEGPRVARSLGAFGRALAGDRLGAGLELATMEDHCLDQDGCDMFLATPPIGVHRLAAAQWLSEAGDVERARRLLRWQDIYVLGGWRWLLHDVLAAPTYLARGRLEEAAGNRERASEHYQQFLRRYRNPVPSQAHLVQEARQALARMQEP